MGLGNRRAARIGQMACWISILLSAWASGDVAEILLDTPNGARNISATLVTLDGEDYVALRAIVEQSGGAFNVLPSRIRVDLFGATAWLRVGEARVHALSIFSLGHTVRLYDGDVLIAASDVPDFFLKSFRVRAGVSVVASLGTPTGPEPEPVRIEPPSMPAVEPPTGIIVAEPVPGPLDPDATDIEGTPESFSTAPTSSLPPAGAPPRFVLIDPGHGGFDTGYVGSENVSEKSVTLSVAAKFAALLDTLDDFTPALTREQDVDAPDPQRIVAANSSEADLLISLHTGTSLSPVAKGIAVLYPSSRDTRSGITAFASQGNPKETERRRASRRLAQTLADALADATGTPSRGVIEAPVRLLEGLDVPAVMVEIGCVTNPEDEARLNTEAYQALVAEGLVNGLIAYQSLSRGSSGAMGGAIRVR